MNSAVMRMMCGLVACLVIFVAELGSAPPAKADSLASPDSFFLSLYKDRKASQVGDVLHVIIAERASASHVASRDLKRTARTQVGPGEGWLDFLRAMGFQGQHDSKDSAAAVRTGTLTAQVTVRVVERLPNGNLRIEGTHRVSVNRDFQAITLRGEVRPRDIRSDNTVFSYDVANLQVEYSGSDPGRPGKRLGIISRLLNALF